MGLKKLLMVDDSEKFRTMLKEYIKKNFDFEIFEACTGEMGIVKASCVRPDIVLMDISLPRISGIESARQIKLDNPDCQVIILTMFEVEAFKELSKDIKASDFIGKSEIDVKLISAIKKCLETESGK